ncbi:MAG: alpha/beta family hydrolase [Pyrinomonadaceae bacterium]
MIKEAEKLSIQVGEHDTVTALLYVAPKKNRAGITLVLGHGAGANQSSGFMRLFASGLAEGGLDVMTFNFVYSERGRGAPDPKAKLEACYRAVINAAIQHRRLKGNKLAVGGKSMGNVVADLAAALRMNYAYGVEFVEVDPIALGLEKFDDIEAANRAELVDEIKVDTAKYKGLHGTAILSRYRLENVRLQPFTYQAHDWYEDEKKSVAPVEKGKRKIAEQVFLEKIYRQVRRGGRMMLLADLVDPQIPRGRVRIVATHLEDRTTPRNREKQLKEMLDQIKDITSPVILAGDMNTTGEDSTPTSLTREVKKRLGSKSFWLERGVGYALGVGILKDVVIGGVKFVRNQSDPTVKHVPIVAPNPAAGFFDTLKDFRFSDGTAFDFRGERERSVGQSSETLGNSNERGSKGFVTTFEVERKVASLGKFKLDWFFIKPPSLSDPDDRTQPHLFAPHFGRTLKTLNYSIEDRISDHSPILVDLPFQEPRLTATAARKN